MRIPYIVLCDAHTCLMAASGIVLFTFITMPTVARRRAASLYVLERLLPVTDAVANGVN